MISLKAKFKWKYLWKCMHERTFGATKQQLNLHNVKNKIEMFAEIWSLQTTLKLGETRRRKAKASECE